MAGSDSKVGTSFGLMDSDEYKAPDAAMEDEFEGLFIEVFEDFGPC